jgi:hypothetical protein
MGLWKRVRKLLPVSVVAAGVITLLALRKPETLELERRVAETPQQYEQRMMQGRDRLKRWGWCGSGLTLAALAAAHVLSRRKGKKQSFLQPAAEHPFSAALAVAASYGLGSIPALQSFGDWPFGLLGGLAAGGIAYGSLLQFGGIKPPYLINYPKKLYDLECLWFAKPAQKQHVLERMRTYWSVPWTIDFDLADSLFAQKKVDQGCLVLQRALHEMPEMPRPSMIARSIALPLAEEVSMQGRGEHRIFELMLLRLRQGEVENAVDTLDALIANTKDPSRFAARAYVAQTLAESGKSLAHAVKITPEQTTLLENRAQHAWQDAITVILNDGDREKQFKRLGESRNEVLEYAPNEFLKGLLVFKRCDEKDGARLQRERENIEMMRVRYRRHVVQSLALTQHGGKTYHVLRHNTSRTLEDVLFKGTADERLDALKHSVAFLARMHQAGLQGPSGTALQEDHYAKRLRAVFYEQLIKYAPRSVFPEQLQPELTKVGARIAHELSGAVEGWYKDANARNWLVENDGSVIAIDFENRVRVPVHLDLVSLLEFGPAAVSEAEHEMMLEHYLRVFARKQKVDRTKFLQHYQVAALHRHLEIAGYRARDKEYEAARWHIMRARVYAVALGESVLDEQLGKTIIKS